MLKKLQERSYVSLSKGAQSGGLESQHSRPRQLQEKSYEETLANKFRSNGKIEQGSTAFKFILPSNTRRFSSHLQKSALARRPVPSASLKSFDVVAGNSNGFPFRKIILGFLPEMEEES